MKTILILSFMMICSIVYGQDTLSLKGKSYNKFTYGGQEFDFKYLSSVVADKPVILNLYRDCVKSRKSARITENLALISLGLGVISYVTVTKQSSKKYVFAGVGIGLISIPIKIQSRKKIDRLITSFNNPTN